jgi:predicted PurR-regulated permease PerM
MHFERNGVFWVVALVAFVGLLWLLSPILLPFVLGMSVAYVLEPLNHRLTKRGMSRVAAAAIILTVFVICFALLLLLITPLLVKQLWAFLDNAPAYAQRLQNLLNDPNYPWLKHVIGDNFGGTNSSAGEVMNRAMRYINDVLAAMWSKSQSVIAIFSLLIVTPVVAFYLACDWDRMLRTIDDLIPLHQRDTVHKLVLQIDTSISAYVHGQSALCLILGSYYAVALTLAGLSFGFLIGVVGGLISFIPYVGSLTVLAVSLCVAVAQFFPDWSHILLIVALILIGQFLEGNVLAPKFVGHSVGLHPVWLMFALFAFGYLFGFVGLLLAVPLAAAGGVLARFALQRYRESPIYTGCQTS